MRQRFDQRDRKKSENRAKRLLIVCSQSLGVVIDNDSSLY